MKCRWDVEEVTFTTSSFGAAHRMVAQLVCSSLSLCVNVDPRECLLIYASDGPCGGSTETLSGAVHGSLRDGASCAAPVQRLDGVEDAVRPSAPLVNFAHSYLHGRKQIHHCLNNECISVFSRRHQQSSTRAL